ncbi:MAG TPA: hypothetical protein VGR35_11635 [Tepidisphaeraceae bacterium]|nr:hypothetical protein [Tepidisphaeraceae bacterium]
MNEQPLALIACGKYDVSRALPAQVTAGAMHIEAQPLRPLPSAA